MSRILRIAIVMAMVLGVAPGAFAAADPAHKVFDDPLNDGGLLAPDFTPPYQDLTAGYITDTADTISFTWEVADLSSYLKVLDVPNPGPVCVQPGTCESMRRGYLHFYWEFALASSVDDIVPCTEDASRCFSLRISLDAGGATPRLSANCTTTGTLVTCQPIYTADVKTSVDGNQVTATLRRSDIGNPADGSILYEQDLFQGIGAYTGFGVVSGNAGDLADLGGEGYYTFAQNRA